MKQTFKNAIWRLAVLICVFALTLGGISAVWAQEVDDETRQTLISNAEGLVNSLVHLTDEDIADLEKSTDSFTLQAVDAWKTSRDELGAIVEDAENPETTLETKGSNYTVTVSRTFEHFPAGFVFIFNRSLNPETLTIDTRMPIGTTLGRAGLNTLVGILTVFCVLIFLSFVISLLKYIPGLLQPKAAPAAPASPARQAPAAAEETIDDEEEDDDALIAVIAAAIAASEGTTPDGFVVRSIRRVSRRAY
jgi:sodium pump decarboxylase gamma subunit